MVINIIKANLIEDSYLWIDNDVEDGTAKQGVSVAALFGRVNNKTSGITVENSYIGQSVYICECCLRMDT